MLDKLPSTRYMGSKQKMLDAIGNAVRHLKFNTVLDAFSGTGSVSYLFKAKGKQVISNDFMYFCYHYANALIANNHTSLSVKDLTTLLAPNPSAPTFYPRDFCGIVLQR